MSDILFGQSYYLHFDAKLYQAMKPYPPLGTLYAASLTRQAGYSVALFDAMLAASTTEWVSALEAHQPRCAVLFEDNFNYLSKMCLLNMREAAFEMISAGKAAGCKVIVVGSDASDHPEAYLDAGADVILLGEGEATLLEVLPLLLDADTGEALTDVLGVAFYRADGSLHLSPRRPDIKDLDALPHPAWDLVDLARYRAIWLERHGYWSLNIVTTRGCPFHCNWCAKPIWGQRYNAHSPEYVAEELAHLAETYQPDHVWFADDIFGLKPGWIAAYADALADRGLQIPFKCLSRADLLLREGDISALRRAGCEIVWIGAESGSQAILDAMDKGTRIEQIQAASQKLQAAGIKVGFFLQVGYPGETWADIQKTLHLVRDCQPDDIGMSVSYPLPGTRFHAAVRHELDDKANWTDSADLDMLFLGSYSSAFYRHLHTVLHKEFRARQSWRKLSQRQPLRLRQVAAMIYHSATLPLARLRLARLRRTEARPVRSLSQMESPVDASVPSLLSRDV